MKMNRLFVLSFVFLALLQVAASVGLLTIGIAIGVIYPTYNYIRSCYLDECCNNAYVIQNTQILGRQMKELLYGQHIAQNIVYNAIRSHLVNPNPRKPLVLSFHGGAGTGKNYVASMIARSMFKLGEKSKYFHFFNGRGDFPFNKTEIVDTYKMELKQKVERALSECVKSVFVFDEIDKIAPGILDILVPFMDYTSWSKFENKKAIFIFIANTGSGEIVNKMVEFWEKGKKREEITIQDFEHLIERGAFNEEGGLFRSGTIESKVIDYHVPFLPLEEKHVVECIKHVFRERNFLNPSKDIIAEALKTVTFGPPPYDFYSTDGCKKLYHKVSSILYSTEFDAYY